MRSADLLASRARYTSFLDRYKPLLKRRSWAEYAEKYIRGLLTCSERKSIEPIALESDVPVRTMRYFIGNASWDDEALLDEHHRHVAEALGHPQAVLILDTTGFPKKGTHSVGVKRQWCGQLGKEENCQVAVTLSYASCKGHTLLSRSLYLPEEWARDSARRRECGVPEDVAFQRSWELGLEMVAHSRDLGVPHAWLTGDEEFGQSEEFHDLLHSLGEKYIFEVKPDLRAWDKPPKTRPSLRKGAKHVHLADDSPKARPVREIAENLPRHAWEVYEVRSGSKGPLQVRVAWMPVFAVRKRHPGPAEWLVITRTLGKTPEIKYFLSNAPPNEPVESMLSAAFSRFAIEQCHEQAKQELGLGEYETRSWNGWHHHTALVLIAHHFLVTERLRLGEKIT